MWLPRTSRTRAALVAGRSPRGSRRPTHGPPAFTTAFARTSPPPSSRSRHPPPSGSARSKRLRVRISAPRAAASRAFSTTSRASSTQQSEYSNAFT